MTLSEYLSSGHGRGVLLARRIGRTPGWVSGVASGRIQVKPFYMALFECLTDGDVAFDDWKPPAEEIEAYLAEVRSSQPENMGHDAPAAPPRDEVAS